MTRIFAVQKAVGFKAMRVGVCRMATETKTTGRSLEIIAEIKRQDGARLDELVAELEIARSTVHRHLRTLIDYGYVIREGESYHIDLKFLNLGTYARTRKQAYLLIEETLYDLTDETDEECEFIAENDGRGILVYETYHPKSRFEGANGFGIKDSPSIGTYFYLHNHAAGKAILASLSNDQVEGIVDKWGLPPKTEKTITDRDGLRVELERVRERGVAHSDEEFAKGLREVAHCVENPDGTPLGAISVMGPLYRMERERFYDELPALLEHAIDELETRIENEYIEGMGI